MNGLLRHTSSIYKGLAKRQLFPTEKIIQQALFSIPEYNNITGFWESKDKLQNIRLYNSNLVLEGDSRTVGVGATSGNTYPEQLQDSVLLDKISLVNYNEALSGDAVSDMLSNTSVIDNLYSNENNILVIWGGVNDFIKVPTVTANTVYNRLKDLALHYKSVGYTVFVCTELSATAASLPVTYPASRNEINDSIRSEFPSLGINIIDLATNENIGGDSDPDNTTYFVDKLHLTDAGYAEVANEVEQVITSYLISQSNTNSNTLYNDLKITNSSIAKFDGITNWNWGDLGLTNGESSDYLKMEGTFIIDALSGIQFLHGKNRTGLLTMEAAVFNTGLMELVVGRTVGGLGLAFDTPTGTIEANKIYYYEFEYDYVQETATLLLNGESVSLTRVGETTLWEQITYTGGDFITGQRGNLTFPFTGKLGNVKITVGNYSSEVLTKQVVLQSSMSEGVGLTGYDRITGNSATVTNILWDHTDHRPNNWIDGYDLWSDNSDPTNYDKYLRVPLLLNGNSIKGSGDAITGYTWLAKYDASGGMSLVESKLQQYIDNDLFTADERLTANFWYVDVNTANEITYNDIVGNYLDEYIVISNVSESVKKNLIFIKSELTNNEKKYLDNYLGN